MRSIIIALILTATLRAEPRVCSDLCSDAAVRGYGYLLASTGFTGDIEHAAFVVRDAGGGIRFVRWMSNDPNRARYGGAVPQGCIAIAHTHPHYQQNPSHHDIEVARRTRIPIIVITPFAITIAQVDGRVETLFSKGWVNAR